MEKEGSEKTHNFEGYFFTVGPMCSYNNFVINTEERFPSFKYHTKILKHEYSKRNQPRHEPHDIVVTETENVCTSAT